MINGIIRVISDEQINKLHEGVLNILENTGLKIYGDYLLQVLADNGCDVDFEKHIVKFKPELVEKQLKSQAGRYKMVRSSLWYPFCMEQEKDNVSWPDEFSCDYGHGTSLIYDYREKKARRPNVSDQINMIRLGHSLEGVKAVCCPFILDEFDTRIEVLESARILLNNTDKPGWVGTYSAKQLKYLGELAKIAVDGNEEKLRTMPPLVVTVMCTTSPLKIDNRSCEVLEEALKHDYPINFSSMPILGATTPITPAGSAIVAAAEIVGGITAASLINPRSFYYSASISAQMDMKTMQLCYSSPMAVLTDAIIHQLFRYKYNIVHNIEPAYIDAKIPNIQAAYFKLFRQFTLAATAAMPFSIGLLDNAALFSPTQAMIDYDINYAMYQFSRGVTVDDDSLALDTIKEIAFAEKQIYLDHDHTFSNFRSLMWETGIFDRRSSLEEISSPEIENKKLLDRADEMWREKLQNAPIFELDKYKRKEVDRIVSLGISDLINPSKN